MNNVTKAIIDWNQSHSNTLQLGDAYQPQLVNTYNQFLTGFLFPKVSESIFMKSSAYNRFQKFITEDPRTSLITEETAIMDTVPTYTNFEKDDTHLLSTVFPKTATMVFSKGDWRKFKFTINLLTAPRSFYTFADVVEYSLEVYQSRLKMINVIEEKETLALLIDRASVINEKIEVNSLDETVAAINLAIRNIQKNNRYNEVTSVMGEGYEYTDTTLLDDIVIITNTRVESHLMDSVLAQNFHNQGIDPSEKIMSFKDFDGVWQAKEDITLTKQQIEFVKGKGMYNIDEENKVLRKGSVITFNIPGASNLEEIKTVDPYFTIILDKRGLTLKQDTSFLKAPQFINSETMNISTFMHYASTKYLSIFTPKVLIGSPNAEL